MLVIQHYDFDAGQAGRNSLPNQQSLQASQNQSHTGYLPLSGDSSGYRPRGGDVRPMTTAADSFLIQAKTNYRQRL